MTVTTEIECDGCDKKFRLKPGAMTNEVTTGFNVVVGSKQQLFDLCTGCQQSLAEQANSKLWPRAAISFDN